MAKESGKLAKKPAKKAVGKKLSAKKPAKKRSGLPLPAGVPAKAKKPPQAVLKAEARHLEPLDVKPNGGDAAVLDRLWETLGRDAEALPLSEEQRRDLDQRLDALEQEGPSGVPWDEAVRQIRSKVR